METPTMMHLEMRNRNQLPWTEETWKQIDMAVHYECQRTKVASKFLPIYPAPGATTIPSDTVLLSDRQDRREKQKLTIDETATTAILELEAEFQLTYQQMMEPNSSSAITLATRAANLLSQGVDIAIFQGQRAISGPNAQPLFADGRVAIVSGNAGRGLINAPEGNGANPAIQVIEVPTTTSPPPRWGENTFGAVSDAYSRLQSGEDLNQAHYGPYACILNFQPYADTYAPLSTTLTTTADRLKPLVTEMAHSQMMNEATMQKHAQDMNLYGRDMSYMYTPSQYPRYYGTGTLPILRGIFLSLGGNTMDLVISQATTTEYVRQEGNFYCFRVFERFALRLKDITSVIRLEFQGSSTPIPG